MDFFGEVGREVFGFGEVVCEVVELGFAGVAGFGVGVGAAGLALGGLDVFPWALADGEAVGVLDEIGAAFFGFAEESGKGVAAVGGGRGIELRAGQRGEGGAEIDLGDEGVADAGPHAGGPTHDEGDACAAFKLAVFAAAQRAGGFVIAQLFDGFVFVSVIDDWAVVAAENDESVLRKVEAVQGAQ